MFGTLCSHLCVDTPHLFSNVDNFNDDHLILSGLWLAKSETHECCHTDAVSPQLWLEVRVTSLVRHGHVSGIHTTRPWRNEKRKIRTKPQLTPEEQKRDSQKNLRSHSRGTGTNPGQGGKGTAGGDRHSYSSTSTGQHRLGIAHRARPVPDRT